MPKFSIRSLLLWVAFVGLCIAGLKYPSEWYQIVSHLVTAAVVGYSIPMAFICVGKNRVFWISICSSLLTYLIAHEFVPAWGAWQNDEQVWTFFGHAPHDNMTFDVSPHGYGGFVDLLHVLIGFVFSTAVATFASWSAERHLKQAC